MIRFRRINEDVVMEVCRILPILGTRLQISFEGDVTKALIQFITFVYTTTANHTILARELDVTIRIFLNSNSAFWNQS